MSEPNEHDTADEELSEDDLKGADVHPAAPGDSEDGEQ